VKLLWRSSQVEEETLEKELEMKKKYPELFLKTGMEIQISRMKSS
jgi:undecaprenyl pyrophosphate synthase